MTLLQFGDWCLYAAAFVCFLFVAGYWYLAPTWWRKAAGWNVMAVGVCFLLVLLLNTSYNVFGDWWLTVRPYARIVVYSLSAVVMGQRIWWLWDEQWRGAFKTKFAIKKGTRA